MARFKPSRVTVAIALSAVVIVLAGSGAVASNMGFKLNKGLFPRGTVAPNVGGDNWVSIPYNRPYATFADVCTQLGLPTTTTSISQVVPMTGVSDAVRTCLCGVGGTCALRFLDQSDLPAAQQLGGGPAPYLGVKIRNNAFPIGGFSAIIVGSHNPTQAVQLNPIPSASCVTLANTGFVGQVWFSVPYHTTAITAQDLCTQAGLGSTPTTSLATIARQAVGSTSPTVGVCGFSSANYTLQLGEAVRIRRVVGPAPVNCANLSFIPAHF